MKSHAQFFVRQLSARLPIVQWLPKYEKAWLRFDVMAGLTLAASTIPEALAYAKLAGLPPQAGLYASMIPPILYMFFGTSRQLVIGPAAAISVLMTSGLAGLATSSPEQYAAMAMVTAMLVGVIAFCAYALRLGFLVNFISESVLVGFSTGAGLYIASIQIAKLFGLHGASGQFFARLEFLLHHGADINLWAAALGLVAVAIMVVGEHRIPRVPWPLMVVLGSVGLAHVADLDRLGVNVVGHIPEGFPSPALPSIPLASLPELFVLAGATFLLSYLEGMSLVRTFSTKHNYRTDANQELFALGVAGFGAGLTQAYPVAGSFSRSALNDASGAKTQLASGVGGFAILLVVLFLTGLFTQLPEPILASVVLVAVRGLFRFSELRKLYTVRRMEFWPAFGTLVAVLVFGILEGVIIGALMSLLIVIGRASEPRISELGKVPGQPQFASVAENPDNITIPGLLILRPEEGVFYANAEALRDRIVEMVRNSDRPLHGVVLDLEMTSDLDLSGAHMLADLAGDFQSEGVLLRLSRVQWQARSLLERTDVIATIGFDNVYPRTLLAVATYLSEEVVHGHVAYDILPDLVNAVREMVSARAALAGTPGRERLETVVEQLDTILKELDEME